MALIYDTTMHPTKLELLAGWLPTQPWFSGSAAQIEPLGAYRFDDPAGEVGMEGHLLRAGDDRIYHAPVTYRGAPIDGADAFLIGTSDHGILGKRWIYDATGDPVYQAQLAQVIAQGGKEAAEIGVSPEGRKYDREILTKLRGSGEPGASVPDSAGAVVSPGSTSPDSTPVTDIQGSRSVLSVRRHLEESFIEPSGALTLRATWPGQVMPVVVATLSTSA